MPLAVPVCEVAMPLGAPPARSAAIRPQVVSRQARRGPSEVRRPVEAGARPLGGDAPAAPAVKVPVDTLTVARSWHGRPQTKRIGRDRQGRLRKHGFAQERLYTFATVPVLDVRDLAATL